MRGAGLLRCLPRALGVAGALLLPVLAAAAPAAAGAAAEGLPWWVWPLGLLLACFVMGIVAVPAGIGGGTLFVPIIGSFFPFHLDFVRGAGLLVALASALSAAPTLLRSGLGSLRLALPLALLASASSIAGAFLGLAMPVAVVQMLLGGLVLGIVVLMAVSKKSEFPEVAAPDRLSQALALHGVFLDGASGRVVNWQVHRTVPGLVLSLVDSSAAWVYINEGAVLPMVAVPSVVGMMLGARIGARLLHVLHGAVVRRLVITVLLFAGLRALLKGMGVWP